MTDRPILKLAIGRAPKSPTAVHKVTTLGEHKNAFLNVHNRNHFLPDEEPEKPDSLSAVLRPLLEKEFTTKDEVKELAQRLTELSEGGIDHRWEGYKIIARVLGYREWHHAVASRDDRKRIINLNYGRTDVNLELFGLKDSGYKDRSIVYGADCLEKITFHPLKLKQFLYHFNNIFPQSEFLHTVQTGVTKLADVIDRHDIVIDIEEDTRFFFRSSRNDPTQGRVCAIEFVKDRSNPYKNVGYFKVNLANEKTYGGRRILSVDETIRIGQYEEYAPHNEYAAKWTLKRYEQLPTRK